MQVFIWLLRLIVFLLFICFAAMNSEIIVLHYYHERSIEMPVSVALLLFFALGVLLTIVTASKNKGKK